MGTLVVQVFISYAHEDRETAEGVAADLMTEGLSVFFDVRIRMGDRGEEAIDREIAASSAVVTLWSPHSRDSAWVRRESRAAKQRGILRPAMISECAAPLEFSDVQAAVLLNRHHGDLRHPEWRRLVEGIHECIDASNSGVDSEPQSRSESAISYSAAARVWRQIADTNDLDDLRHFIETFAGSEEAFYAKKAIAKLEERAIEDNAYEKASQANSRAALLKFADTYPRSPHLPAARAQFDKLPPQIEATVVHSLWSHVHINDAACSLDGTKIATVRADEYLTVWDAHSGAELKKFWKHMYTGSTLNGVALSPDGSFVASANGNEGRSALGSLLKTGDRCVRVWNVASGLEVKAIPHAEVVVDVAFSPRGDKLASASEDGVARIWSTGSFTWVAALTGHSGRVNSISFSADGDKLATAGADKTARIWDVSNGRQLQKLAGHDNEVTSAHFDADGKRIVTCSKDASLKIWNAHDGELIATFKNKYAYRRACFLGAGQFIVAGGIHLHIRDSVSGSVLAEPHDRHSSYITALAVSSDERRFVTSDGDGKSFVWLLTERAWPPAQI
jgi:hypothetical protein